MQKTNSPHIPVLREQVRTHLGLQAGDTAIDCTAGYGGHLQLMLDQVGPSGQVIAFDRDPNAIRFLQERFQIELKKGQLTLLHSVFSQIKPQLNELKLAGKAAAILADIGVSSPQLDQAERGFSMIQSGKLDMRMNPEETTETAADIVNQHSEAELRELLWKYGEEPKARFIARAICEERAVAPIDSTEQLSRIVEKAVHYKTKSRTHPATRTFQALRIAVNQELEELDCLCQDAFEMLRPGGRLLIVSFHSLEDRVVKQRFSRFAKGQRLPKEMRNLPLTAEQVQSMQDIQARIIKPFPMIADPEEQTSNPRSRSAKLRVIEKNR